MKLYQTIDGTMIGFYRERGGEVQTVMYQDVYENQLVTKTREERTWIESTERTVSHMIPGFWDTRMIEREGYFEDRAVRIPEHQEEQLVEIPGYYEKRVVEEPGYWERHVIWVPEYTVTRYREVPGHYEIQPVWFEEHTITKYYWREAHPARGLEEAWIPYEAIVPAGFSDTRVWVDTYTEEYEETIPAGEKLQRVWIEAELRTDVFWVDPTWEYQMVTVPEAWGTETIYVEPVSITERVWISEKRIELLVGKPGYWKTETIVYQEFEEVWVGYDPVYEYVDESQVRLFEVLELYPGAGPGPDYEDVITLQNKLTGEELKTTARFLGLASKIADNEYVLPW